MAKPLHLILATHPPPFSRGRVRGREFTKGTCRKLFGGRGRFALIMEGVFLGKGPRFIQPDLRDSPGLIRMLEEETSECRANYEGVNAALARGEERKMPLMASHPFRPLLLEINKSEPGKVLPVFSDYNREAQVAFLEAVYWRNAACVHFCREKGLAPALVEIEKSLRLIATSAGERHRLLIRQAEKLARKGEIDALVVTQGLTHEILAGKRWEGLEVEAHRQPDMVSSYQDELLIRILAGESIPRPELVSMLEKELAYSVLLMELMGKVGEEAYAEDLMRKARAMTEGHHRGLE